MLRRLTAPGRGLRLAIVIALITGAFAAPSAGQTTALPPQTATTPTATATTPTDEQRLAELEERADHLDAAYDHILLPITVLIGILALGGALGIVFSIRDQQRVSQLHELTVNSELSEQRRTEQSYSSFLEASQKTLTLVNDTLELAKESSDRAAHTMELKTTSNLDTIEARAEELVHEIIDEGDLEKLVDVPENRTRLQAIASDLEAMEGYMLVQDIEPQPYSRFVKGIDQYLRDDITGARRTLRYTEQDHGKHLLQRCAAYWSAKFDAALGRYTQAIRTLEASEDHGVSKIQQLERQRALIQTRFFQMAAADLAPTEPIDRLRKLLPQLETLERLSAEMADESASIGRDSDHALHEIEATRADLYAWIAYSADDLCRPFGPEVKANAWRLIEPEAVDGGVVSFDDSKALLPVATLRSLLEELESAGADVTRAFAQLQVHGIVSGYDVDQDLHLAEDVDFSLAFSKAEADFMFGNAREVAEYRALERLALEERAGRHREHRHSIELAEVFLICKVRLLASVEETDSAAHKAAESDVNAAGNRLREEILASRDHLVTAFSHLQRRNVELTELSATAKSLVDQALHPEQQRQQASGSP